MFFIYIFFSSGRDRLPTTPIIFLVIISPPLTTYPLKLKSNPLPQKDNSEESEMREKEKKGEGKVVMKLNLSVSHE